MVGELRAYIGLRVSGLKVVCGGVYRDDGKSMEATTQGLGRRVTKHLFYQGRRGFAKARSTFWVSRRCRMGLRICF